MAFFLPLSDQIFAIIRSLSNLLLTTATTKFLLKAVTAMIQWKDTCHRESERIPFQSTQTTLRRTLSPKGDSKGDRMAQWLTLRHE